jgi:uncharacterized SAM-binding protein YcdF (DUF218 family)
MHCALRDAAAAGSSGGRARSRAGPHWLRYTVGVLCVGCAGFVVVTATAVIRQAGRDDTRPAGAIVVFGAAEYAGRPSPVFRARLDHAYELFQRGFAPLVITTGGAARDPRHTEGEVGRDYLISRGIPDLNLIAETRSEDTAQSAVRTATILRANGLHACLAVSDAYHMFRVKRLLEAEGITVYVSPRPDSIPKTSSARAAAALREAVSYLLWVLHL